MGYLKGPSGRKAEPLWRKREGALGNPDLSQKRNQPKKKGGAVEEKFPEERCERGGREERWGQKTINFLTFEKGKIRLTWRQEEGSAGGEEKKARRLL